MGVIVPILQIRKQRHKDPVSALESRDNRWSGDKATCHQKFKKANLSSILEVIPGTKRFHLRMELAQQIRALPALSVSGP